MVLFFCSWNLRISLLGHWLTTQITGQRLQLPHIPKKIDFKIKTITTDKEGHYIIIKGSIQEEGITIVNIYAPNIGRSEERRVGKECRSRWSPYH